MEVLFCNGGRLGGAPLAGTAGFLSAKLLCGLGGGANEVVGSWYAPRTAAFGGSLFAVSLARDSFDISLSFVAVVSSSGLFGRLGVLEASLGGRAPGAPGAPAAACFRLATVLLLWGKELVELPELMVLLGLIRLPLSLCEGGGAKASIPRLGISSLSFSLLSL